MFRDTPKACVQTTLNGYALQVRYSPLDVFLSAVRCRFFKRFEAFPMEQILRKSGLSFQKELS